MVSEAVRLTRRGLLQALAPALALTAALAWPRPALAARRDKSSRARVAASSMLANPAPPRQRIKR